MALSPEEAARTLLNTALREGVDEAEVYIIRARARAAAIEGGRLRPSSREVAEAVVRVSIGKRVGAARATSLSRDSLESVLRAAISIARSSEEDPHWSGFADPGRPVAGRGAYDEDVAALGVGDVARRCLAMVDAVKREHPDLNPFEAHLEASTWERYVCNTRGVEAEDRGTVEGAFLAIKGRDGAREISIYEHEESTKMLEDLEGMALDLADRVKRLYGARKLEKPIRCDVVFSPKTAAAILYFVFSRAISATNVQEGRSPLAGRLGERIGSGELTILDDGTMEWGLSTSRYDDEGVPRRVTRVVEGGVLKSFLYDTYSARREGRESTGNATRMGVTVLAHHSNLVVKGSERKLDDLLAAIDEGVYAVGHPLNVHSSNYITGEINAVLYEVYYVRKGSIEHPLMPLNLTGNIYEAFKGVKTAEKPRRTPVAIYAPYVLLPQVSLVHSG